MNDENIFVLELGLLASKVSVECKRNIVLTFQTFRENP